MGGRGQREEWTWTRWQRSRRTPPQVRLPRAAPGRAVDRIVGAWRSRRTASKRHSCHPHLRRPPRLPGETPPPRVAAARREAAAASAGRLLIGKAGRECSVPRKAGAVHPRRRRQRYRQPPLCCRRRCRHLLRQREMKRRQLLVAAAPTLPSTRAIAPSLAPLRGRRSVPMQRPARSTAWAHHFPHQWSQRWSRLHSRCR